MNEIILEIKNKIPINQWVKSVATGRGNVGITLESLLGKEAENFELPDYKGIELKTKFSKREKYITLFSSVPDSYLFEIKRIHEQYGYPDYELPQFNVFNVSVYGNRKIRINDNYFGLFVDYKNEKVVFMVYDNQKNLIDNFSSWSFELLKEKLERKLSYLAFIKAERKYELGTVYFKYVDVKFYKLSSFEKFLKLLEMGFIKVSFRIGVYKSGRKYGQIYDHGTTFNINEFDINRLFDEIIIMDQDKIKKELITKF